MDGQVITIITTGTNSDTFVGTYDNSIITYHIYENSVDVTSNYIVTTSTGTLEITKRDVTIKPIDYTKVYDGALLNINTPEIIKGSIVETQNIYIWTTGSNSANVGIYDNVIYSYQILDEYLIDTTTNYNITLEFGKLEITPRPIEIHTVDSSKVYDGYELYQINLLYDEASLVEGHMIVVVTYATIINVGEVTNEVSITIIDGDQIIVDGNYDITLVFGMLKITPRPLIVKPMFAEKEYDDETFNSEGYVLVDDTTLANHQTIKLSTSGTKNNTDHGTYINEILQLNIYQDDLDVTSNYDISFETENIVIHQRQITIQTASEEIIYNGNPLVNKTYEVIYNSFVDNHHVEIFNAPSITNVGNILNDYEIIIRNTEKDVTFNYDVTYVYGLLEVLPRPVDVMPEYASKIYDDTFFNHSNPIVTGLYGLVDGHTIYIETSGVYDTTDVGIYENKVLTAIIYNDDEDVTYNYDITFIIGYLEILHRHIRILTSSADKIYDGIELLSLDFEYIDSEPVAWHYDAILDNASITNVSMMDNHLNIQIFSSIDDRNVTNNYVITYEYGQLEITPRPIEITTQSSSFVYDGMVHEYLEYSISKGNLVLDHFTEVTTYTQIVNVGEVTNKLQISIFDGTLLNVTDNYDMSYVYGSLEVTPRPVTFETDSKDKVYDGKALNAPYLNLVEGTLVLGHDYFITMHTEITDVSKVDNIIEVSIFEGSTDVTTNYLITYIYGNLEVTPRLITIAPMFGTKVYDDEVFNYSIGYAPNSEELVNGHDIYIETSGVYHTTDVGIYMNEITSYQILDGQNDVTSNYDVTIMSGTLEITHRYITVASMDSEKIYDGLALFEETHEIVSGSLVKSHTTKVIDRNSIENVSIESNDIIIEIYRDGYNVTSNYIINYEYGQLEVKPRPITIQTASETKVYDGTPLFNHSYEIILGNLVGNHQTILVDDTKLTNVDKVDNELRIIILNELEDLTYNYVITYEYGQLEITPRPIEITTQSSTFVYDGMVHEYLEYSISKGNLVLDHFTEVTTYTQIVNVGEVTNKLQISIFDGTLLNVTDNYDMSYVYGSLEVTPRPVTFETDSKDKVYDGKALNAPYLNLVEGTLVLGHDYFITMYTEITDVSKVDNIIEVSIFDGSTDVTTNYLITYIYGSLEVTPRLITIAPMFGTKVYDDEVFNYSIGYAPNSEELVNGHDIHIETSGVYHTTDVGIYMNEITSYQILDGQNDVTSNYDVTIMSGTLEITHRYITVASMDSEKIYDGLALFEETHEIVSGSLVKSHTTKVIDRNSIENVSIESNDIIIEIYREGYNVTSNYIINYEYGQLEVKPRPITIQTASETKVYDGTPLFNHSYEIILGNLVGNHQTILVDDSKLTNVDKIDNELRIIILNDSEDLTYNYVITYEYGQLEITPRPITFETDSKDKVYDGTVLNAPNLNLIDGTFVLEHNYMITMYTQITDVSKVDNIIEVSIFDGSTDVTINYLITYRYGSLEVIPRKISVLTGSKTKAYDGTPLFYHNIHVLTGSLVLDHQFNIIEDSKIIDVGQIKK